MDINNINNINNFKIINNQKINTNQPINKNIPLINESQPKEDNITPTDINTLNMENIENTPNNPELLLSPTTLDNKTNEKDKVNNEVNIPKNLAIFEVDNDSNFSQKQVDVNKIRAFGPTNLPKTPEEMFINPKYL
jgi:hypothetical protein